MIERLHRATAPAEASGARAPSLAALGLSAAWAEHVARMPPLTRALLALGTAPSDVDASRLLLEQVGTLFPTAQLADEHGGGRPDERWSDCAP